MPQIRVPTAGQPSFPPMEKARVGAVHVARAIETASELGAAIAPLLAESGLEAACIEAGEPVAVRRYLAFLDAAARSLRKPLFGLHVGLRATVSDVRAYSLVLLACKDVRTIVEQVCRFEGLEHDLFRTRLGVENDVAHLRIHSPWFDEPGGRHLIYFAAAGLRVQSRWLTGADLPMLEFVSALDEPDSVKDECQRLLGGPMRWGAALNEVRFPAFILDLPIPSADPQAFAALRDLAEARLREQRTGGDGSIAEAVQACIYERMSQGDIDLAAVASRLKMAPRTLQRRLREAKVSFSNLVNDARREQAKLYLANGGVSMIEIALLLGFSEQSTFNHAFRAWFGTTPGQWRAAVRGTPETDLGHNGSRPHEGGAQKQ